MDPAKLLESGSSASSSLTELQNTKALKGQSTKQVKKPPKKRVHKVKQGRRPKLSSSQLRKLARLYVLTNLSLGAIVELVNYFGDEHIKLRALHYILEHLFSTGRSQLRPRTSDKMKERLHHFQNLKPLSDTAQAHTQTEKLLHLPVGQQLANREAPNGTSGVDVQSLEVFATAAKDAASTGTLANDESYLALFDQLINHDDDNEMEKRMLGTDDHLTFQSTATDRLNPPLTETSIPDRRTHGTYNQFEEAADQIDSEILGTSSTSELPDTLDPALPCEVIAFGVLPTLLSGSSHLLAPFELKDAGEHLPVPDSVTLDGLSSIEPKNTYGADDNKGKKPLCYGLQSSISSHRTEHSEPAESADRRRAINQFAPNSEADTVDEVSCLIGRLSITTLEERELIRNVTFSSYSSSSRGCSRSTQSRSVCSSTIFNETPLMAHIRSDRYKDGEIERLIAAGSRVNDCNSRGETALHIAVKLGKLDATRSLLDHYASLYRGHYLGPGVLDDARVAQRRAKNNESLYARITACMALVVDVEQTRSLAIHQNDPSSMRDNVVRRKDQYPGYFN